MQREETTTVIITRRDRTRLENINKRRSLPENFTTVIDLYERALMTPAQIDAANSSEVFEAEHVIELALEVLHDKVVSCDGCIDFSEWEKCKEETYANRYRD